ncbi:MAG: carbon storage regulator [Planctomycetota bacterium]
MLVLSRKQDDSVEIPDLGVSIQVLSVRGNRVQLGFVAPSDVRIVRGELGQTKQDIDLTKVVDITAALRR